MPIRRPVKPPGPTPTAIRSIASQPPATHLVDQREQPRGVARPLAGRGSSRRSTAGPSGAQTATAVAGVAVSIPRITRPRSPRSSPPPWARCTRAPRAPRGHAPGACSGHSTKAIASGAKNGSSRPGILVAHPGQPVEVEMRDRAGRARRTRGRPRMWDWSPFPSRRAPAARRARTSSCRRRARPRPARRRPARSCAAKSAPARSVASGPLVERGRITAAEPYPRAGDRSVTAGPDERKEPKRPYR